MHGEVDEEMGAHSEDAIEEADCGPTLSVMKRIFSAVRPSRPYTLLRTRRSDQSRQLLGEVRRYEDHNGSRRA